MPKAMGRNRTALLLVAAMVIVTGCRLNVRSARTDDERPRDLLTAIEVGQTERVRELIDRHPEWINGRSELGNRPLFVAAYHGHESIIRLLLQNGAEADLSASGGLTALHAAAIGGHEQAVRTLLDYDANVNLRDDRGRTPLHYAVQNDHLAVAETLVSAGASATLADADGQTPLDMARNQHSREFVDLLTRSSLR